MPKTARLKTAPGDAAAITTHAETAPETARDSARAGTVKSRQRHAAVPKASAARTGKASKGGDRAAVREGDTPVEVDWIAAARQMLIEGGIASVQISPLATRLGVTRGGFYWRFRNRQDLLDHLLVDWHNTNTRPFLMAADRAGTPRERYNRIVRLWIDENDFVPEFDTAVRQWGAIDQVVAEKVRKTDEERIAALTRIFADHGEDEVKAMVRAQVLYYHQIGYYTLGMRESSKKRRQMLPIYTSILTNFE